MTFLTDRTGGSARSSWTLDPARIHLNHGSYGGTTIATAQHQEALLEQMRRVPGRWFAELPDRLDEAVGQLATVLGLPREATAPVPNASAAATVAFRALDYEPGSVVLVNNHNYGAVVHALRRAVGPRVRIDVVDVPLRTTDEEIVDIYAAALRPGVRAVLLDQFTSSTGMAFPLRELVPLVQAAGAKAVVDGAHAPGLVASPYPDPAPDVWFGNLHKHLCAPLSGALLVLGEDLRERAWPIIDSWNADEPYPRRFLIQGATDATAVLAAPFAHEDLEREYGWDRIRQHARTMTDAATGLLGRAITERWGIDPDTGVASPSPAFRLLGLPRFSASGRDESAALRAAISRDAGIEAMVVGWGGEHYLRLCSHAYTRMTDYEALATNGLDVLDRYVQ